MKRIDQLRDLSDDHHNALVLGQRCRRAEPDDRTKMAQLATRTFHDELAPHFAIEETHLVPALEALGEHILAERICADHAALRELIAGVGAGGEIAPFGERLMEHVRFEERDVFERTQHRLGRDALTAIAAACREAMHRRPARSADEAQQPHSTDSASSQTTHMHSKEST